MGIKIARQRIVNSIEDGINMSKRAKESQKYNRLEEDSEYLSNLSNKHTKKRIPKKTKVKEDEL